MNSMNELKYTIDGTPVSPRQLIEEAAARDSQFASDHFKRTSVAASILRSHGHFVDDYMPQESD